MRRENVFYETMERMKKTVSQMHATSFWGTVPRFSAWLWQATVVFCALMNYNDAIMSPTVQTDQMKKIANSSPCNRNVNERIFIQRVVIPMANVICTNQKNSQSAAMVLHIVQIG